MAVRRRNKKKKTAQSGDNYEGMTVKQALIKALVIGGAADSEITASRIIAEREEAWSGLGAVDTILDLDSLLYLHEISDTLPQCVAAYVGNIELNGWVLKPKLDLGHKDAKDKVGDILEAEAWADAIEAAQDTEDKDIDDIDVPPPSEEEIESRTKELQRQIRRETYIAKAWFENCSAKNSFEWLRGKKRTDEEVVGHGCWEVLRDSKKRVRRLEHIPGHTILPMSDDGKRVNVERLEWVSSVSTRTVTEPLLFRKYVQKDGGNTRYFKEFGDPRAMDSDTGKVYEAKYKKGPDGELVMIKTAEEVMKADKKEAIPATEVVYFPVESPHTPAGMIRWAGWIVSIFGNRAAAESNLAYFENHAVPEAALLIGGGKLTDDSARKMKGHLTKKHKGSKNHGRLLIMQALAKAEGGRPGEKNVTPEMKWINLSEFQKGDGNFIKYTENNQAGLTSSFRQSPILVGKIPSDLNRATAWAVLFQADRQVYGPLRREFDRWVNKVLLPSIHCYAIEFESLSPVGTDIETMSKALEIGIKGGAFTPNEIRKLFSLWLNEPFEEIEEDWAKMPSLFTLNGITPDGTPLSPEDQGSFTGEMQRILNRYEELHDEVIRQVGAQDGIVTELASIGG
jgi:capsid portal protein